MDKLDEVKQPTLQDLLERDKQKIADNARKRTGTPVDPEDEMLAEFGLYFGWGAVWAVKNNSITAADMHSLIIGARKVNAANRYNKSIDMYYAFAASQTEQGGKALNEHLGDLKKI